jgi:hypothetical protein
MSSVLHGGVASGWRRARVYTLAANKLSATEDTKCKFIFILKFKDPPAPFLPLILDCVRTPDTVISASKGASATHGWQTEDWSH